jgi:hypothetical protein
MLVLKTLFPILVSLSCGMDDPSTWVEQKEGNCILRDFGDRLDAPFCATKLWFGKAQALRCSFYVASSVHTGHRNAISAGGTIQRNLMLPLHHGYCVAFLDRDDNLIACEGGGYPEWDTLTSLKLEMPIPKGVHERAASYKVAYYESPRPIGETSAESHFHIIGTTNDVPFDQKLPSWKSDGELRGSPYRVRIGSRVLPVATKGNWEAEVNEGTCALKKITTPDLFEGEKQRFPVALGERLKLKVECRFNIGEDNAIETWVRSTNPSDKKMFGEFYIAFFDKYGNLVGSSHWDITTEPRGSNPSVSITPTGGEPQPMMSPFQGIVPVPIPLGFEEKITSYKVTLYESEWPIGENGTEKSEVSRGGATAVDWH